MYRIRPWLSIGTLRESRNQNLLRVEGISAILQLADTITDSQRKVCYLPIEDEQPIEPHILTTGISFICAQYHEGQQLLIACEGGISRSSTFAIAGLKQLEGRTLPDTLTELRQQHPHAWPSWELWHSLCTYFGESTDKEAYWRAMI